MDIDGFRMPFGKYKGKPLDECDLPYLDWLLGRPDLKDPLKSALEEYLSRPAIQRSLQDALEENSAG